MHVGVSRFFIFHLFAVYYFWCLLDDQLLEHLDLLFEVASAGVIADLTNAVFHIFALDFNRRVLQKVIQSHFSTVLLCFPYFVSNHLLVLKKFSNLVLGNTIPCALLLHLLLRLP